MFYIILGKPLVFWLGLIVLISFITQIYLGIKLSHGRSDLFKYHRLNALILCCLVTVHIIFGLLMYFSF